MNLNIHILSIVAYQSHIYGVCVPKTEYKLEVEIHDGRALKFSLTFVTPLESTIDTHSQHLIFYQCPTPIS